VELSGVYTADVRDVLHSSFSSSFDLRVSGRDDSCCLLGMMPCSLVNGCLHFARIYRCYVHRKGSRQWHTYSEVNPADGGSIFLRNLGSHVKFEKKKSCFFCNITRNLRKDWVAVEKGTGISALRPTDTLNGKKDLEIYVSVSVTNQEVQARPIPAVVVLSVSLVSFYRAVWGFFEKVYGSQNLRLTSLYHFSSKLFFFTFP
jgi:hypothetical protein